MNLPAGWVSTTLGAIRSDASRSIKPSAFSDELFELYSVPSFETGIPEIVSGKDIGSNKQTVEVDTVLLCKINPRINRVWIVGNSSPYRKIASTEWIPFFPLEAIQPKYLRYFLQQPSFKDFLSANVSGIGGSLMRINPAVIHDFPFPVPPMEEQVRIVYELDVQLERLSDAERSLTRLVHNTEILKLKIIESACDGKLVPTEASLAREAGTTYESGEALLARVLADRRATWERHQARAMIDKPHARYNGSGKYRYREPLQPPVGTCGPVPEGWTCTNLATISALRSGITKGPRRKSDQLSLIPYLRVANVQRGFLDLTEIKTIEASESEQEKYRLETGDILFTEGGDRDKLGRGWIWEGQLSPCIHQNHIFRARLYTSDLEPRFFSWYANFVGYEYFAKRGKQTTNLASINLTNLSGFPLPLPPVLEQERIVAEVNARLAGLESAKGLIQSNLNRVQFLRERILGLAFDGKLVPQDPAETPASLLLNESMGKLRVKQRRRTTKPREPRLPTLEEPSSKLPFTQLAPDVAEARDMKLLSLKVDGDYKSLHNLAQVFRDANVSDDVFSPICLVGLNGSGKSNLIEALCEIFCYLEIVNLPYEGIPQRAKQSDLRFDISYEVPIKKSRNTRQIRVTKDDESLPIFREIKDAEERIILDPLAQVECLPTRIVGYSSGLNETISVPFFKTQSFYSEEVRNRALTKKKRHLPLAESRTLYMDYDSNAAILLANYLFSSKQSLSIFRKYLRISDVSSFQITLQFIYGGNRTVKLTPELNESVEKLRQCATESSQEGDGRMVFFYEISPQTRTRFRKHFGDAKSFFTAIYKLSLLNALALKGRERKLYRREDIKEGLIERPPTISKEDKIFSIDRLRLTLTKPKKQIDYAGISDGEHQFIHVFGTVKLFDEAGCLFLLDEPETHFNPLWRKEFVQNLQSISSTNHQEFVISTHSPFIVSGCRRENVIKFERAGNSAVSSTVDFETFGSSFDFLLTKLFDLNALISEKALGELRELVRSNSLKKLEEGSAKFGESFEKQFLFEKIAKIKNQK